MNKTEIWTKSITANNVYNQVITTAAGPNTHSGIAEDTNGAPKNEGDSLVGTSGAP